MGSPPISSARRRRGGGWGGGGDSPRCAHGPPAPHPDGGGHIPPHPAQPQHTNDGAPRTRKRHPQEHRPQRPTERSDPTQHAKGRTGDCPGPRKETTTRRNVTQGVRPWASGLSVKARAQTESSPRAPDGRGRWDVGRPPGGGGGVSGSSTRDPGPRCRPDAGIAWEWGG